MNLKKYFCGREIDRMPDIAFKMMSFLFKIMDIFYPFEKRIAGLGLKEGFTVVDYGCGPGRYIDKVSRLVGETGKVYAVDIHELAISSVKKKIEKYDLKNVEPVLVDGYSCDIEDNAADVIYALDMFHMIKEPVLFLKELRRIVKKDGFLIIDDGHQARKNTKVKLTGSDLWTIAEETKDHLKCVPV
ncbi:MAG: class I SAM-dependent methyltransferase [Deltaproteobacteria bacterium]|nr:class I SAM-dependent methyltransferase [Deltaproteobacteria bacterium]MBW2051638.1 class I SAM-dependent methyltransferase [Deltaproteobacteria bacterium]MBW2141331.1 class I SAM-dependent methyltransferase [Deltaproteobacteria bacterium]MBW2322407.1 class I SAM-dependent methyltransferase [Deltaproteobacteria bacterium]